MSEFDNFWGVIWLFNEKMTQTDASAKKSSQMCYANTASVGSRRKNFFLVFFFLFWAVFFCLRQRRRCCDVSACVEETKNKQRKYGDQPHRQAREEGNGQKGWNYNFGKNRSRTKRPPAKNGRFWAGAGRAVGWAGWACWRFMKRWKFEKSSFFILGTKGLGREGQSALFPPPVITQTVGGTNIKNLGFLVPCELLSYIFQRGQII